MSESLKKIAEENEAVYDRNPCKGTSTIPIQVKHILKHRILLDKHPSFAKTECKIDFQKSTTERAILDAHVRDKLASIVVLNFADRESPGGLYMKGVNTQEESLCRAIPGLYRSLHYSNAYPYQSYETLLWSPKMWFQRNPDEKYQWLSNPIPVAVVSAAAPNLPAGEEYSDKRFRKLLEAIVLCPYFFGQCDVLILGRLGCGAFQNNPTFVARAFASALKKHAHLYPRIVFAIPEKENLEAFAKHFV